MAIGMRVLATFLTLCWAASSQAVIVTSNLNNPSAYPSALFVGTFFGDLRLGVSFTTDNTTYLLNAINIDALTNTAGADPFTISLHQDSAGLPGAVLATLTGPASPAGVESYTPTSSVTLLPLTTYFVTAEAQGPGSALYGWVPLIGNDTSETGPGSIGNYIVQSLDGGAWTIPNGINILRFSVEATAVPEASAFVGVGLFGFTLMCRHLAIRWGRAVRR